MKHTVHVSVLNKDYEVQGRTIDAYHALEYQKAQSQIQADTMRQSLKKSESVVDDAQNAVGVYESGMKMIKGQLDFIQNMLDLSDADAKKLWNLGSIERQVLVQEILGYAEGKSEEQVEADIQDLKSNLEEQAEASNESGNKKLLNKLDDQIMDYDIMLKRSLAAEHEAIKEFGWSLETYENTDLKRLNAVITAERQESADSETAGMTKY